MNLSPRFSIVMLLVIIAATSLAPTLSPAQAVSNSASIVGDWACSDQSLYRGAQDTAHTDDFSLRLDADGTVHSDQKQFIKRWRQTPQGVLMNWDFFIEGQSQTALPFTLAAPGKLSADYSVTGSRGDSIRGRVKCAQGGQQTADIGRRWRFVNHSNRELRFYINDGDATSTGSSCDTNRSLYDGGVLKPGEDIVELCHGRDGFCVSFSERDNYPRPRSPWVGASCKGSEPAWRQANNIRELDLP